MKKIVSKTKRNIILRSIAGSLFKTVYYDVTLSNFNIPEYHSYISMLLLINSRKWESNIKKKKVDIQNALKIFIKIEFLVTIIRKF